jgi:hypothetical protein
MFNLFDLFGSSAAMKAFDHTLRVVGVHPLLVPEAVKLTVLKIDKKHRETQAKTGDAIHADAAELLAYCILGRAQFIESNDLEAAGLIEQRFEAAMAAGDSRDAKIILLALHSGLISPEIADRIETEDR